MRYLLVLAAILTFYFARPTIFSESPDALADNSAELYGTSTVLRVIDGDTIVVKRGDESETVRLIGIDTPETVDPKEPVECFGPEASAKAKTLLDGKQVRLEPDRTQGERDVYGRVLAYVFLPDGTDFGELMLEEGFAYEYTYRLPYRYQAEFKKAEYTAREAERGLWDRRVCDG